MKKILSLLGVGLVITTTTITTVACAERAIPSIASSDNIYMIEGKAKYDVSKWTKDVMDGNKYKDYVLNNFKSAVMENAELNWTTFATKLPDKDGVEEQHTIMDQIIFEYVESSNVGEKITLDQIKENINYSLYDASNKEKLVKVFATDASTGTTPEEPSTPLDELPKLSVSKHEATGVYVMHFKVAIEAKEDSELFMGKRVNYVKEDADAEQGQAKTSDIIKYYNDIGATKDGKIVDESHANALPIFIENDELTINEFDYMFDILFNFSIN